MAVRGRGAKRNSAREHAPRCMQRVVRSKWPCKAAPQKNTKRYCKERAAQSESTKRERERQSRTTLSLSHSVIWFSFRFCYVAHICRAQLWLIFTVSTAHYGRCVATLPTSPSPLPSQAEGSRPQLLPNLIYFYCPYFIFMTIYDCDVSLRILSRRLAALQQ